METRINTDAIFKNDNKKAENHPDYKGKVNVNGKDMEVALWFKNLTPFAEVFSHNATSISLPFTFTLPL